jgi:hypothetical protein
MNQLAWVALADILHSYGESLRWPTQKAPPCRRRDQDGAPGPEC